jgi:hypothetical protein
MLRRLPWKQVRSRISGIVCRCVCWYVFYLQTLSAVQFNLCVLAMGYFITWNMTRAITGSTIFQAGGSWITAFFVLTMSTNVYCTSKSHQFLRNVTVSDHSHRLDCVPNLGLESICSLLHASEYSHTSNLGSGRKCRIVFFGASRGAHHVSFELQRTIPCS